MPIASVDGVAIVGPFFQANQEPCAITCGRRSLVPAGSLRRGPIIHSACAALDSCRRRERHSPRRAPRARSTATRRTRSALGTPPLAVSEFRRERCLTAAPGLAAAANLADQQERSSVGMSRGARPQSKSKGQFAGYGGDAPCDVRVSADDSAGGRAGRAPAGAPRTVAGLPPNWRRRAERRIPEKDPNPTVILTPSPELKYRSRGTSASSRRSSPSRSTRTASRPCRSPWGSGRADAR